MADGGGVEVGMIGPEGLVEAFHLLGNAQVPTTGVIQVEGMALRISFADLRKISSLMQAGLSTDKGISTAYGIEMPR